MVLANVSDGDLREMVDNHFKDVKTGELKLKSFTTVQKIVDIYCNLSIETREKLFFGDYLRFNVHLYNSLKEAVDDGLNLDEYQIIKNSKLSDEESDEMSVVLVGDWRVTLE